MDGKNDSIHTSTASTQNETYLNSILSNLSNDVQHRLDIICDVASILNIDEFSFASYSSAILELSAEKLAAKRLLTQLDLAEKELRNHLAVARHEERLINKWMGTLQGEIEAGDTVISLEKRREALVKKAKEYRKSLDELMQNATEPPAVTVADLMKQREKNRAKEQGLKAKRAKLSAFQGLPPNLELARHELQTAQNEYTKLLHLRERLLGTMGNGLS